MTAIAETSGKASGYVRRMRKRVKPAFHSRVYEHRYRGKAIEVQSSREKARMPRSEERG